MKFSFKASMSNPGFLPFVIAALYGPGPATLISVSMTRSERENSTVTLSSNKHS